MSARIRISWQRGEIAATLRATPTADALLAALPLERQANTWGAEVYFDLPFSVPPEPDATDIVDRGAVCFWLAGDALALLFGPTPVSDGEECRLISAANIVGMLDGDIEVLHSVRQGDPIRVDRA